MVSTRGRFLAIGGAVAGCALALSVAVNAAGGPPQGFALLLCGTTTGFSADRVSGNSSIDHPSGLSASGMTYQFTNQNCRNNNGSSNGSFSWAIRQDNVNLATEMGNEHADATSTMLTQSGSFADGFDGRVFEYDLPPNSGPGSCTDGAEVFYASGHIGSDDSACSAIGDGPGNFNTEGGASSGQHLNGKYGTLIYQFGSSLTGSQCGTDQSGPSQTYCFEAVIVGQSN